MVKLHEISPREQDGRDTLSRYKAQTRAAGLASLEILENKSVDRVYCDWHDDYVVRKSINGKIVYHFFQVKTKEKRNAQWSLNDIFGVHNRTKTENIAERITESFAGKLLIHTVNFIDTCEAVVFLTNIHLKDEVEDLLTSLDQDDYSHKTLQHLTNHFLECFCGGKPLYTDEEIKVFIRKFRIIPGLEHLKVDGTQFEALAREKIFEFSEIDLEYMEAREILDSLLNLIEKKSIGVVRTALNEKQLDELAGVGIEDLLEILSISKIAFQSLREGGDKKALKNVSILQRILGKSGTPKNLIDYAAKCKTDWDVWYRKNRHYIPDYDLAMLESKLSDVIKKHSPSGV
ncbi:dsDNA nuclease domain-containing protein, partial [Paraglaciecola hydrolytica]